MNLVSAMFGHTHSYVLGNSLLWRDDILAKILGWIMRFTAKLLH